MLSWIGRWFGRNDVRVKPKESVIDIPDPSTLNLEPKQITLHKESSGTVENLDGTKDTIIDLNVTVIAYENPGNLFDVIVDATLSKIRMDVAGKTVGFVVDIYDTETGGETYSQTRIPDKPGSTNNWWTKITLDSGIDYTIAAHATVGLEEYTTGNAVIFNGKESLNLTNFKK